MSVEQTMMQGVLIGFPRSGKSSLKLRLLDKRIKMSASTGVAEKVTRVEICKSTVQITGLHWKEIDDPNAETAVIAGKIALHAIDDGNSTNVGTVLDRTRASSVGVSKLHENMPLVPHTRLPTWDPSSKPMPNVQPVRESVEKSKATTNMLGIISNSLHSIDFEKLKQFQEDTWTLYLTDTGGQPEFQELLPVLVSGPALFFLVFRLDRDLSQKHPIEYLDPTTRKSVIPYKDSFTMEEMILQSLASIASTRIPTEFEDEIKPSVLFVGTHKDKLQTTEMILKVDQKLQQIVKNTEAYRKGMVVFMSPSQLVHAVDNTSPIDEDFRKVRATVEKISRNELYRALTPLPWLMFAITLCHKSEQVISYDECSEIGEKCGIDSCADLDHVLWFMHHRLGIIRHFQNVPELQHVVIKDPQYIFDKITELIVNTFTFEHADHFTAEEFLKKGIFPLSVFKKIATGYYILTQLNFIALLEELHIIAPLYDGDAVTKYFVPCALTHAGFPPKGESKASIVPPLFITFSSGYCPKGVFGSLVVHLINNDKEDTKFSWELEQDEIYRNQVSLFVGPYDLFRFELHPSYILVELISAIRRRKITLGEVCCDVRQCLDICIQKVTQTLHYSQKVAHSLAFTSPKKGNDGEIYPATINFNDGVPHNMKCTLTGKRVDLPDGYLYWFDEVNMCMNQSRVGNMYDSRSSCFQVMYTIIVVL